jgi:hypothetical protein
MLDFLLDLRLIDYVVIISGLFFFIYIFCTPLIILIIKFNSEDILKSQKIILEKLDRLEGQKNTKKPEANISPAEDFLIEDWSKIIIK